MKKQIIVISDLMTIYGRSVLAGMGQFARTRTDWSLFPIRARTEADAQWQVAELDPVGVITRGRENEAWMMRLRERGVPIVQVAYSGREPWPTAVLPDHYLIGRMGAEHLLQRGYRSLAIRGTETDSAQRMVAGFVEVAQEAGVPVNVLNLLPHPRATEAQIISIQRKWIRRLPRPLGLMAVADESAVKLIHSVLLEEMTFGRDVAVLGFSNDIAICESVTPMLSSISIAHERIGYLAAQMLNDLMQGKPAPKQPIRIPPTRVVVRESTDLAATDDLELICAVNFIRDHMRQQIGVQDVADHVGLSRRTLERRFSRHLRHTVDREIRRQRIEQAKRLLIETDLSVKRITAMCGFSRPEHLSRSFRMLEETTPLVYRREHTVPL